MSEKWQASDFEGPASGRLLDRLVDGSLPEAERRQLLLRLEAEPDGWRRCALAFLEAQTWREAFAPLAGAASVPVTGVVSTTRAPVPKPRHPIVRGAALAACVLIAFTLGWALRPPELGNSSHEEIVVAQSDALLSPMEAPVNVSSASDPAPGDRQAVNSVFETVVKSWQQLGYSAERQETRVTMTLHDGRQLEVPIEEVKLRYTGDRTY